MDLNELREYLNTFIQSLQTEHKNLLTVRLKSLSSVFPFNEYEYMLMFLLDKRVLSFPQYESLRNNYVSSNRYLELYGISPRVFGQIWGEKHITDLDKRFQKPDKIIDPKYDGQYDLWLQGVRVEVKAARAINTKKRGDLVSKALRFSSSEPFWMNFQQIKLDACEVFVFIGVWADQIIYWVLSNEDVKKNQYLSHQHRGGIEYQIGITHKNITEFDKYKRKPSQIGQEIIKKGKALKR